MKTYTRIVRTNDRNCDSVEVRFNVEWKNTEDGTWRKYAEADSVCEAEKIREVCFVNRGKYPTVYETRNGLRRYKVTRDFSFHMGSYNIYYKLPLEKWMFHHIEFDYDSAVRSCSDLAKNKGPRKVFHTGPLKYLFKFFHTVESCALCIRYPFLYPRNRFTGKHYSNFELDQKIETTFKESHECTNPVEFHKGMTEDELHQMNHPKYRTTDAGKAIKCMLLKIYRGLLEIIHCVPVFTELDAMDYGWRKAFGKDLLKEVKKELKRSHLMKRYRIMQIKEKWGELCWYDNGGTDELFKILRKYEGMSYSTCINCGKPAKYRTNGWIVPYCEDCMDKKDIESGNYSWKKN